MHRKFKEKWLLPLVTGNEDSGNEIGTCTKRVTAVTNAGSPSDVSQRSRFLGANQKDRSLCGTRLECGWSASYARRRSLGSSRASASLAGYLMVEFAVKFGFQNR